MSPKVHSDSPRDDGPRVPRVGVGCLVVREGRLLLVRNHEGFWSTPGGHLGFGEAPDACAARETAEETGIHVSNIHFVAITSDHLPDPPRHYITIWMRADGDDATARVGDSKEVAEVGWFPADALPEPRLPDLLNLCAGRCWPSRPPNLPFPRS